MTVGMKVGPQQKSFADIDAALPDFVEIWFDVSRASEYEPLFEYLHKRNIRFGLHFWGALSDGTWTTIAYPDAQILKESIRMMQTTIDIAQKNTCLYVNIHPGSHAHVNIDFKAEKFTVLSRPADLNIAIDLFIENAKSLHAYAQQRGIIFTVETVPAMVTNGWHGSASRDEPISVYELPIQSIQKAAQAGLWIANDFCHTAASYISNSRDDIWNFVRRTSIELASQTKLIHAGFVVPPYNGTDLHDMLDNPAFHTPAAVPTYDETRELLNLFKTRSDVWILTEPSGDHPKNYHLLKALVESV